MPRKKTRHSKADALNEREYQLLLEGASKLTPKNDLEARFIILVGGRLGLRRGEITHLRDDWINWRRNMIEIPRYDDCDRGRDYRECGSCRMHAKQKAEHNADVTFEEALDLRWETKTDEAARSVPFDFDPRVSLVIERFFEEWDRWMYSAQAVNRRLEDAAEAADNLIPDDIYPHCLRATAASYHAARGLDVIPLQSLMGWAQVSTAHNYVKSSGENTQRALRFTHSQ
jgi:integrase